MAVATHARRRLTPHRPRPRRGMNEPESALPLVLLTLVIVVVVWLVLTGHLFEFSVPRNLIPGFQPAAQHRPTDGAMPMTKLSLNAAADGADSHSLQADSLADTTRLAVGARARVANTDNLGVVFYAAPRDGTRQPAGLLEGTAVTVLEVSGTEWARVQADAKKSGWVRAQYLAPTE